MSRNIYITAVKGNTGFFITELLVTNHRFFSKINSITGLSMHHASAKCKELAHLGIKIVPHKSGREKEMVKLLKKLDCDTICLISPAY
jgi:hypothetical protein